MNLQIRPGKPADARAVAQVYLAARKCCLPFAPLIHSDSEVRQWIADEVFSRNHVTVAEAGSAVIGMMAVEARRPINWISHLYLQPDFTGRRIGSQLVDLAKEMLGAPIRLYTFQANTGACRFYERHGFRPIFFGDGSRNEERCPDVLYEFEGQPRPAISEDARLAAIYLSPAATVLPLSVNEVEARGRQGLIRDRYFIGIGTFSDAEPRGPGREVTLIESEVLAGLSLETGLILPAAEARRNLVTKGVRLNALVGNKFRIGDVLLEGIRLCDPCTHLDRVTGMQLLKPLANRGGLRASILCDGVIRVGDRIALMPEEGGVINTAKITLAGQNRCPIRPSWCLLTCHAPHSARPPRTDPANVLSR